MSASQLLTAAKAVGETLEERGWKLATAESCTGGWVSQALTEIPGSSNWFDCGFVTYSNASKEELLDVPSKTLEQEGAVSRATACAMAIGALTNSHADVSVAITGIAGPDGGTPTKAVGLVWFAWAISPEKISAKKHHFTGNRHEIRAQAVQFALEGLLSRLRT